MLFFCCCCSPLLVADAARSLPWPFASSLFVSDDWSPLCLVLSPLFALFWESLPAFDELRSFPSPLAPSWDWSPLCLVPSPLFALFWESLPAFDELRSFPSALAPSLELLARWFSRLIGRISRFRVLRQVTVFGGRAPVVTFTIGTIFGVSVCGVTVWLVVPRAVGLCR